MPEVSSTRRLPTLKTQLQAEALLLQSLRRVLLLEVPLVMHPQVLPPVPDLLVRLSILAITCNFCVIICHCSRDDL